MPTEETVVSATQIPFLAAAFSYRARHWSVIPVLRADSKKPARKWKELQTRLPTDEELHEWFDQDRYNLGIPTGAFSGFFALDVDGAAGWRAIKANGGLPHTVTTESRPGRQQFWFKHPGWRVANAQGFLPGLDLRGDGGFVQTVPSVHQKAGTTYRWIISPDEAPFAAAPAWLLAYTRKSERDLGKNTTPLTLAPLNGHAPAEHDKAYAYAALVGECHKVHGEPDGTKHRQLLNSAIAVAGFVPSGAITAQEIEDNLFAAIKDRAEDKRNALETIRDGIEYGRARPRTVPPPRTESKRVILRGAAARHYIATGEETEGKTEAKTETAEAADDGEAPDVPTEGADNSDFHPYILEHGRIKFYFEKTLRDGGKEEHGFTVCDFSAHIVEEIAVEDDEPKYLVEVRTPGKHGALHRVEIGAKQFTDGKQLGGALSTAAGAQFPVRAGMEKHLPAAIKLLTGEFARAHRFNRTGWWQCSAIYPDRPDAFLIRGKEPPDTTIHLPRKLPYCVDLDGDTGLGLEALEHLLRAQKLSASTVLVAFLFGAPLSRLMEWQNERYALHLAGRTGSLKSSLTQAGLCLYGPDFINDSNLIKWGDGATRVAMMTYATHAGDLPFGLDNFKPNVGGGAAAYVAIIHNILEGSDRDRGRREGGLRESKLISAWPLSTGEDLAHDDASALARILVVRFAREKNATAAREQMARLNEAQRLSPHLCAVGAAWLTWLESEDAKFAAQEARDAWLRYRAEWGAALSKNHPDMVNPLRVATNLATQQATWQMMERCPLLAALAGEYRVSHLAGLRDLSGAMAAHTTQALEATRFLNAIQELLASGRAVVSSRLAMPSAESKIVSIGWQADSEELGGAYLFSRTAIDAVLRLLGPNGLNSITDATLYDQLAELGAIGRTTGGKPTLVVKNHEGKCVRVLHVRQSALEATDPDAPSAAPAPLLGGDSQ